MMGRIVSFPAAEGDTRLARPGARRDRQQRKQNSTCQGPGRTKRGSGVAGRGRPIGRQLPTPAVRTAEANKQLAETTFARYKELYDRRSASAQEFDEAQSRLDAATSELDRARANVQTILAKNKQINARIEQAKADIANTKVYEGYSRIVSPVSGIVVKKFAESGATASPGSPLLSIEDNSQYRLEAECRRVAFALISVGNRVNIRSTPSARANLWARSPR